MSSDWCTIESDPGVFTELLENIGVKGVELEELWTLDNDSLAQLDPVFGLIFLFKWTPGTDTSLGRRTPLTTDETPPDLFFARQVTTNACATQAILSIIFNAEHQGVDLGSTLSEFKSFTTSFPPDLKGEAIGASAELQQVHNSFARKDSFLHEGRQHIPTGDEDIFHFVAYLPFGNKVYELDGLQNGPILIGELEDESTKWYSIARAAIQQRMDASPEIKFNLMAVVGDRRILLEDDLAKDPESAQIQADLAAQHAKREQWKLENQRRQHNYVPLCVELLKVLAEKGRLPELITQAGERVQAKYEKSKA
mmetsp:Transcript_30777/g.35097  ORF Transcript_30777/g.35097 Transcript_30777/m.35097 type:complete len:310 (-) Transcript_30777:162-1091(-)|eukprot:CAMPEP_0194134754 /NCGR_PEP_ID=MMETSP0152-20130528/4832_1 /TAXON_ID=1049557 /ORGANISM="Thalassiothrix antarctica, Strain L6-D1" /LENGTH=309 /DNA_ID=CAMNT_0038830635 /DNA_START=74 /DNA_END=1003 /DNA_ORIENTATION=-